MTDPTPEIIEKALREFVKPRLHTNMALDGTRANLAAALSAVADDLRAEGAAQALRAFADAHRMPWTMFLDANEMPVTVGDLLRAEADRIEHDGRFPHQRCPGGSLKLRGAGR